MYERLCLSFHYNEGSALKLPPGLCPGPRASKKEGGRVPGPSGRSVWGWERPSRVWPGGFAALDRLSQPLTGVSLSLDRSLDGRRGEPELVNLDFVEYQTNSIWG